MKLRKVMYRPTVPKLAAVTLTLAICTGCWQKTKSVGPPLWHQEPGKPLVVAVTGNDFNWYIRYPGQDGRLGTTDDIHTKRNLNLPVGIQVELQLTSLDYIYTLSVPQLDLREVAVPELLFPMNFTTESVGHYELLGDQMCGFSHPNLIGQLTVQTPDEFETWLGQLQQCRCRRMSNDYEELTENSYAMIPIAMIRLMLRRLASAT